MKKAANHFEIRIIKKNDYFFHEGEPSKFFAGLIKGKISFKKSKIFNRETGEIIFRPLYKIVEKKEDMRSSVRKLTNRNENISKKIKQYMGIKEKKLDPKRMSVNNSFRFSAFKPKFSLTDRPYKIVKEYFDPKYYRVEEEELFQADSGYCFGEWALIYNQPRSASVIALEDSVFFILDEKIFSKTFLKCLNYSEHKKKKFILESLFPFNLYSDRRNSLYKDIVPRSYIRNQIIFNEGDIADTIYLIYSGTFFLEKNFKNRIFRFKSVEKGSLLGLESLFEGEEGKYKCTMKLSSLNEFGVVACCKVRKLAPYLQKKMKSSFKKNYSLYIQSNEDFYSQNINYENNIIFKKKNQNTDSKSLEKFIEEYSLQKRSEKMKNKKIKFNFIKQTILDKKPITDKNITIEVLNNTKEKINKSSRKKKKAKTLKINKKKDIRRFTDNINNICYIFRRKPIQRMTTLNQFSHLSGFKKENYTQKSNEENDMNIKSYINMDKFKKNNESNFNGQIQKIRKFNVNLYIKDLLAYDYIPSILEDLKEKSKNNKNNILKTEESKSFNKTFYGNFNFKSFFNPKTISRNEQNEIMSEEKISNFTEFPTIERNKNFRFDSGRYKLPLMTQVFKK